MDESDGVWRTICGRKVFIKKGQSVTDAMRESGKFSKANINVAKQRGNGKSVKTKTSAIRVYEPTITAYIDENGNIVSRRKRNAKQSATVNYVERFRSGEKVESEIEIADVGAREREEIERLTGEKVTATTHVLHVDELIHIEKRHGKNGEHDHSMADVSSYKHIGDVLRNPDKNGVTFCYNSRGEIELSSKYKDKNNQPAKMIMFTKTFNNHIQMVVEAVTDTKAGKLRVITSYKKKKHKK